MTLPAQVWAALALEPAAVEARGRFHATYANLRPPRFTPVQLMELLRDEPIAEGRQAVAKIVGDGEVTPEEIRYRLNDRAAARRRPEWIRTAEVADAWRECAMARLLLNTETGKRALLRAADSYRQLGLPFGDFLGVAATGDRRPVVPAATELRSLLTDHFATPPRSADTHFDRQFAVQAPAQQVALLFTAVSNLDHGLDSDELSEALAEATQAHGSAPVGTTGAALADWWGAGRALAGLATGGPPARLALTEFISEVAYAHGHLLRTAQLDEFHWRRVRSPVDLVDLYLAGLVAISVRVLRRARLPLWRVANDFGGLSPLALVSVTVGLQLAEEDGPPDRRHTHGPSRPGPSDRSPDDRRRAGTGTER